MAHHFPILFRVFIMNVFYFLEFNCSWQRLVEVFGILARHF